MTNFACEKTENCFSHSQTYAYELDFKIDEGFLIYLQPQGELEVKRSFRRPFFILRLPDGTEARGALGDDRMKASFPNQDVEGAKEGFESILGAFSEQKGELLE